MSGLDKNRKRNQTICFRSTPEERRKIEARVIASGLTKGEYFRESLINQKIYIWIGKYESDKLAMQIRILNQELREAMNNEKIQDYKEAIMKCQALLEELSRILSQQKENAPDK